MNFSAKIKIKNLNKMFLILKAAATNNNKVLLEISHNQIGHWVIFDKSQFGWRKFAPKLLRVF